MSQPDGLDDCHQDFKSKAYQSVKWSFAKAFRCPSYDPMTQFSRLSKLVLAYQQTLLPAVAAAQDYLQMSQWLFHLLEDSDFEKLEVAKHFVQMSEEKPATPFAQLQSNVIQLIRLHADRTNFFRQK